MPVRPKIRVDIVSDTVCPWCYIGKRRFEKGLQMVDGVDVEVKWWPYQLNPGAPDSINKREAYERKFGRDRVEKMVPYMTQVGEGEGIKFSFGGNTGNTFNSHRLISWADKYGKQDEIVDVLFRKYFEDEQNIGDTETLVSAAEEVGLGEARAFLESVEGEDEVRRDLKKFPGVSGVPHFVFDGQLEISGGQEPETFAHILNKLKTTKSHL